MNLKALASCSSQIPLPVLGREVVEQAVELGGKVACGLLETKHELIVLRLALLFTVRLLVRSMVLENLIGIFGDANLIILKLLQRGGERLSVSVVWIEINEQRNSYRATPIRVHPK